jgi:hypothetical protein
VDKSLITVEDTPCKSIRVVSIDFAHQSAYADGVSKLSTIVDNTISEARRVFAHAPFFKIALLCYDVSRDMMLAHDTIRLNDSCTFISIA